MCVSEVGKIGGQDIITVSVGGVERLEGVEMGGVFSIKRGEAVDEAINISMMLKFHMGMDDCIDTVT